MTSSATIQKRTVSFHPGFGFASRPERPAPRRVRSERDASRAGRGAVERGVSANGVGLGAAEATVGADRQGRSGPPTADGRPPGGAAGVK
ncbi:MAG TPA: hypothetical protein VK610_07795, partial [Rhodothermales bacterium]|nr:hypothetical protein [Rhodothermales bacterium]